MLYESEHRIGADSCAIDAKDKQNNKISDYLSYNMYPTNTSEACDKVDPVKQFSIDNHRTYFEGYGSVNACTVDDDSKIRYGWEWSTMRGRHQLPKRVFTASPDLGHGGFNAVVEDRVKQGEDTTTRRTCGRLSEISLFNFNTLPMIPCLANTIQDPKHIVPPWQWGGSDTRDSINQKAFLESQGYMFDGFAWKKRACGVGSIPNTASQVPSAF